MRFTRSIRWRLQIWHALLLTVMIAGFGITAHKVIFVQKMDLIDQQLQAYVTQLSIAVPPLPSVPRDNAARPPPTPSGSVRERITQTGAWFIIWNSDGTEQTRSSNSPKAFRTPPLTSGGFTQGEGRQVVYITGSGRCFVVGRSISAELAELQQLAWYLVVAGGGVLVLGFGGGWWIASHAIRPLAVISDTASKIATGDLSQRIPPVTDDELGKLAAVLNATFARLEAAFAQQSRFTADAAHELRTPVSVALMHAQNGLSCANLTDEQREAFTACERSARRMKGLIDSLLELSRIDAGQDPIQHAACNLAEIADDCLDLVSFLSQGRLITLDRQLDPAPCLGDAQRLGQVVINLLDNALEHTKDHIWIKTWCEGGFARLSVRDNGLGIRPQHLPHLFDRFYRVESSRHDIEHNGLGLAISKAIVDAHGGELCCRNTPPGGVEFMVKLSATSVARK